MTARWSAGRGVECTAVALWKDSIRSKIRARIQTKKEGFGEGGGGKQTKRGGWGGGGGGGGVYDHIVSLNEYPSLNAFQPGHI